MMAPASYLLPLFVVLIHLGSPSTSYGYLTAPSCHPDHAAALLQFKRSFLFDYSTNSLPSWFPGTDCCLWEGVGCDNVSGQVTALDLSGRALYSYSLDAALFNLTSLQRLDLSNNDFGGSRIPEVGFERLSGLTHLNLSCAGFYGQIPIVIGKLLNLISLDVSSLPVDDSDMDIYHLNFYPNYNVLYLQEPSLETLLSNLTHLRELYLDTVTIISASEYWGTTLGKSVPHLQVLSMESCWLVGPIPESMSVLRSIQVINLKGNSISGVVPKFFGDFLNLTVLHLGINDLRGSFPPEIFQLKNLGVLDVSGNMYLSGHVPKFPYGSSLQTLNLQGTHLFGVTLSYFGNLTYLSDLGLGSLVFTEPPYSFVNKLDHINTLRLSSTSLSWEAGSNFSWIGDLQSLTTLTFTDCYFSNTAMRGGKKMTSWIGNLTNLRSLVITSCDFNEGPIPLSIGNLTTLEYLSITFCVSSGHLLSSVSNLKNLRFLEMSYNKNVSSVPITPAIGHLNKLEVLLLEDSGFSGRIPNAIANMTKLIHLSLGLNDLVGDVPPFLFTLPSLLVLDLSSNKLSGAIKEFSLPSRLKFLDLSENEFSGNISSSLFQLINLIVLDLGSNNLTGLVNLDSFWKLRKLEWLILSDNKLSIKDGKESNSPFPLLPKLYGLVLKSCNMTEIPSFLAHTHHINSLDLSWNRIPGTIPNWIWELSDLRELNLSNNAFTDLELISFVLPNSNLERLDLSSNRIQGQIPIPNISMTVVSSPKQILDYSDNRFTSIISNFTLYLGQTIFLKISNNGITGYMPHSVCNLSNLIVLDVANNNYRGNIPSCLIEDGSLSILNLRGNHFEGELPYNINSTCHLLQLDINGNNIQGQLPRALSKCTALEVLDVGNNKIVDVFPSWLGNLSNLRILILRSNNFYGTLDDPFRSEKFSEYFSRIQIIDIASNYFCGNVKPQWIKMLFKSMKEKLNNTGQILGNSDTQYYQYTVTIVDKGKLVTFDRILTALTAVDFSNNNLNGSIPDLIGDLVALRILNMSHNIFTGNIPPLLSKMSQLESLDLSWNHISGEIPQELAILTFLETLDLSHNNLEGRIPRSGQFGTFDKNSFEGNTGLCGAPLSKHCVSSSPQPNNLKQNEAQDRVDLPLFIMFVGLGFGLGFAATFLIPGP